MLTKNEKRILENRIYNAIKKGLKEQKESLTRDQIAEMYMFNRIHESKNEEKSQKRKAVSSWLNDPSVDKAQVFYNLFGVKPEGGDNNDKKNARGLGMKKLNREPLPSGSGSYDFSEEEINNLFNQMSNQNA